LGPTSCSDKLKRVAPALKAMTITMSWVVADSSLRRDCICDAVKPGLRFRGFSRPAVFGGFGQALVIGSDVEHLLFEDRIGHVLRHGARASFARPRQYSGSFR
jgi:hypothetical protein